MDRNKPNYTVTLRVKPLLVKKPKNQNIQIVVNPSSGKVQNISNIKVKHVNQINQTNQPIDTKKKPVRLNNNTPPKPAKPANAAVSRYCNRAKNKPTKVKFLTRDIDENSKAKIKQLKDIGRSRILVIVGNGPSINEIKLEEVKNLEGVDFLSINKPDSRLWPTKYWAFFDASQLRRHEELWNSYTGVMFNSTAIRKSKENSLQVKNLGGKGFSSDLMKGLHIGRSSVYAAMQIALWMNYNHVYIIGCDMDPNGINGKLHFYGTNPDVNPDIRKDRFKKEAEYYDFAANALNAEERSRFTFCSSYNNWSFVNKFGKIDHKNFNDAIKHKIQIICK